MPTGVAIFDLFERFLPPTPVDISSEKIPFQELDDWAQYAAAVGLGVCFASGDPDFGLFCQRLRKNGQREAFLRWTAEYLGNHRALLFVACCRYGSARIRQDLSQAKEAYAQELEKRSFGSGHEEWYGLVQDCLENINRAVLEVATLSLNH